MTAPALQLQARYRREFPQDAPLGETVEELRVVPSETALLLVDVYPREGREAEIVRDTIVPAKLAARRVGIQVVYVTNHLADSTGPDSECRALWLRTLGEDVLEAWAEPSDTLCYLPEIAPDDADLVVRKQHYSGFFGTDLDSVLRSLGARDLLLAGFDARICVAATAADALYRDYRVLVLRDAVATTESADIPGSDSAYRLALRYIEACIGYTVTTADFLEAVGRATDRQ